MNKEVSTAGMFSRRGILAALLLGLLSLGLLAGCGTGVRAAGNNQRLARAATPAATGDGWITAESATITPVATGEAAAATAVPENTAVANTGEPVQFAGKVENLPGSGDWSGPWQVGGRLVHVSSTTTVDQAAGKAAVGSQVAVEGWRQPDGSVDAGWVTVLPNTSATPSAGAAAPTAAPAGSDTGAAPAATSIPGNQSSAPAATDTRGEDNNKGEDQSKSDQENENESDNAQGNPHGKPVEFRGTIDRLPAQGLVGDWQVDGRIIHVNGHTRIKQNGAAFTNGTYVQVMGWQQPDGSINAANIQIKKPTGKDAQDDNGQGSGNGNGNKDKGNGNGNGNGKGKGK